MRNGIRQAGSVTLFNVLVVAVLPLFVVACTGSSEDTMGRPVVEDPGVVTEGDWPVITGNLKGQRYSTLNQITADNFENLGEA